MAEIKVNTNQSIEYQYGQLQMRSQWLLDMYVELLDEAIKLHNVIHPNRGWYNFLEEIDTLESVTGRSFDDIMEEYKCI